MFDVADLSPDRPVLIAGPTASGKSTLALEIAERQGGVIVNADSIQVFDNWRVLSARPSPEDEARVPHRLYGHLPFDAAYSAGHWLREVAPILAAPKRPIIVGGTGLYFTALTEGLADIPATPPAIRAEADNLRTAGGLARMIDALDRQTRARIDLQNPVRVQRAWEVQTATGRGFAAWQDDTPPPLLALSDAQPIVVDAPKAWLSPRIARRLDLMIAQGALDEARANMDHWDPRRLSSRAIGAAELIAHLRGETRLEAARDAAVIATRQFAKRQRTWFRARMANWLWITPPGA